MSRRLGDLLDFGVDLGARTAIAEKAKGDVVPDLQGRVEGVAFERHGDIARGGSEVVQATIACPDVARGHVLEAGDHAQRRGLAAAGTAEQADDLAILHGHIDGIDRENVGLAFDLVDFCDTVERERAHALSPSARQGREPLTAFGVEQQEMLRRDVEPDFAMAARQARRLGLGAGRQELAAVRRLQQHHRADIERRHGVQLRRHAALGLGHADLDMLRPYPDQAVDRRRQASL